MPFRITLGEKSWLTEDLTLDELASIEEEVGESWFFAITAPLKTAVHGRAIIKRFLARDYGEDEAAKRVGTLTFKQTLDAFESVEDDRPDVHENGVPVVDPKAGEAAPVTTS